MRFWRIVLVWMILATSLGFWNQGSLQPDDGYATHAAAHTVSVSELMEGYGNSNVSLMAAVEISPTEMSSIQTLLEVTTQTLTLRNTGDQAATLRLKEQPASVPISTTMGAQAQSQTPAEFDPPQIEAQVLKKARAQGEADFWIRLAPQADLSAAYGMDWERRGRFVVETLRKTARQAQAPVRAYLDRAGIDYTPHWIVNAVYVRGGDIAAIESLQQVEGVTQIQAPRTLSIPEPERPVSPLSITPASTNWNLDIIQAPKAWAEGTRGEGVVVANIDTGVRYTHDALNAQYRGNLGGVYDHDYNWYDPQHDDPAPTDDHGHGTHTMGTIIGDDGGINQIGVAPGARWIAADGCDGYTCPDEDLISCGEWLLAPCPLGVTPGSAACEPDLRPHVVNNSWGDCEQETTTFFEGVIDAWRASGIFTAFANGNAGNCGYSSGFCNSMGNPARHFQAVSVGATNIYDSIASFSLWGPTDDVDPNPRFPEFATLKPDVSAPGVRVHSAYRSSDSYYIPMSGTSMATPHVSGVAALMLSANPGLIGQNDTLETLLETSADPKSHTTDCGNEGPGNIPNNAYGWGRVNALQAVEAARTWADIAWLATEPVTVTVPASATVDVDVIFDASATPTGVYTASLHVVDADISETVGVIPLTMTVVRDRVVRVPYASQTELEALASVLDIWEVHADEGYVVAYARFWAYRWLLAEGYDVEPAPAYQFAPTTIPDYPCYRTIDEINAQLETWVAAYPELVKLEEIGTSYEGSPLHAVRLTNQATAGPKPPFVLLANIHGRELITNEAAMTFIERLLTGYGTDADLTWLLDEHEITVVVSLNPDGHVRNEPGDEPWAYWRKNTQPYGSCGSSGYGVDLNRNFDYAWGGAGTRANPCSDVYHGPAPDSEPETQAVQAFAREVFTETVPGGLAISLHSYSNLVLWPWGYTEVEAPDSLALTMLGEKLATFNGYEPKQASDLYPASGTADDWLYGALDVPAYTFEIGSTTDGFYPPCSRYNDLIAPNLDAFVYAAKVTRTPYTTTFGPDIASVTVIEETEAWQITAMADDRENGGQAIAAAEVYVDVPPWDGGTPVSLTATDGFFDTVTETVQGLIPVVGLKADRHVLFIRAQDVNGVWGAITAAFADTPTSTGTLVGNVQDADSGTALEDTLLTTQPFDVYTATTGALGDYTLVLPTGTYTVTAFRSGYYPLSTTATLTTGQTIMRNFALEPWPYRLYLPIYVWDGDAAPVFPW